MRAISIIQTISTTFVELVQPQAENYKPYKPVNNDFYSNLSGFFFSRPAISF